MYFKAQCSYAVKMLSIFIIPLHFKNKSVASSTNKKWKTLMVFPGRSLGNTTALWIENDLVLQPYSCSLCCADGLITTICVGSKIHCLRITYLSVQSVLVVARTRAGCMARQYVPLQAYDARVENSC